MRFIVVTLLIFWGILVAVAVNRLMVWYVLPKVSASYYPLRATGCSVFPYAPHLDPPWCRPIPVEFDWRNSEGIQLA